MTARSTLTIFDLILVTDESWKCEKYEFFMAQPYNYI